MPGGCTSFTVDLLERRGNDLLTRHINRLRDAVRRASGEAAFAGISPMSRDGVDGMMQPDRSKPTPSKKGTRLVAKLSAQQAACLDAAIAANLKELGCDA